MTDPICPEPGETEIVVNRNHVKNNDRNKKNVEKNKQHMLQKCFLLIHFKSSLLLK